jgi:lysylphosphatidylglycerol synthetase-like protein (DUF2156 family)
MTSITTAVTLLAAGAPLAGGNSGFSRAVAGTGPVFLAFLAIHVPAGLTAVISGALAATAPKRRGRHTWAGTVYYWAITVIFATAAAMAAIRPARDWYLALLGALALTLAAGGRDYRRHPGRRPWRRWPGHIPHIITMGASYTVLLTAFYVDNGKNLPLWDRLPTAAYWTLPTLVAAPIITCSAIRHRRPRQASSSQSTSRLETTCAATPRRVGDMARPIGAMARAVRSACCRTCRVRRSRLSGGRSRRAGWPR